MIRAETKLGLVQIAGLADLIGGGSVTKVKVLIPVIDSQLPMLFVSPEHFHIQVSMSVVIQESYFVVGQRLGMTWKHLFRGG